MAPSCLSGLLQVCCVKASQFLTSFRQVKEKRSLCLAFPAFGKGRWGAEWSTPLMFGKCPEMSRDSSKNFTWPIWEKFDEIWVFFWDCSSFVLLFLVGSLSHPLTARWPKMYGIRMGIRMERCQAKPQNRGNATGFHMFSRRTEPGLARPGSTALHTSDLVVLWSTVTRFRPIPGHNEWVAGHVTQIFQFVAISQHVCTCLHEELGDSMKTAPASGLQKLAEANRHVFQTTFKIVCIRLLHAMLGRFWKKSVECVKGHGHVVFQLKFPCK